MNKVALITGGTRGIGFGIAACLAREGWRLALNGRRAAESVAEALDALGRHAAEVQYFPADISRTNDRERLLHGIRERFGALHLLVNNAGVAPDVRADILEAGEESYEGVLRINLQGPYFLTQAVARWMVERKADDPGTPAAIVNISSISATVASPSRGEYCLSKAGVRMATQLWAVRLAEYGIPVYEVSPGIIQTDMTAAVTAKYDALIEEGLCLQKRWGTPEDVGKAVAMLARGDLPYSTGEVIDVSGGMLVRRL